MELQIRQANEHDAQRLVEIYRYYVENTAITFEYDTPSIDEFKERIRNIKKVYPYLVVEKDGKIEGYAYAGVFKNRAAYDMSCEVTIYIDKDAQKCGLGKKLYTELEARLKRMGICNLYACIGYPKADDEHLNKNSAEFHAHLGYKRVGYFTSCGYKFGKWYDMIWMEKIIGEHTKSLGELIPYPELLEL